MQFPKLQLGLPSEYGAFNGNHAYIEGSTVENPQAMIQFFGLPNNRTVEQIAEMPDCAAALAFAQYAVAAINEHDALRAKLAALVEALKPFTDHFDGDSATVGDKTYVKLMFKVQLFRDAKAALAAAESEAAND